MKLFLDIETLPADGKNLDMVRTFWEESRRKSGGKVIKGVNDFETFFRNTSFQGEFGRILCIAYATNSSPVECLSGDEKEILRKFWSIAKEADLFIGHNVMEFDLRFIYKRSIIHQVQPSRNLSFARYRSEPIYDTMKEWEKWSNSTVALRKLCLVLGITSPKEEGIDGSKVYDFFLAGKTDEICEYCKRDVEATRKLYKKMIFVAN